MNPHAPAPISIISFARSFKSHWELIILLTKREIIGRYKGSMMGVVWSVINPVLLLLLYTFVFSKVFKSRWGGGVEDGNLNFALALFTGMIVHGLLSEGLVRAPTLITSNIPYVKKVVFPLEILPMVALGTSIFHAAISLVVLAGAIFLFKGAIPWTAIFLPMVLLPLLILTLGMMLVIASLGVFIRDISHPIGFFVTVLLFGSPVFYPVSALPEYIRPWLMLNPLTFIIEQARAILLVGQTVDLVGWLIYFSISVTVAWIGYAWFQKTRRGFANVL
ncbi:ABC transporter permease [Acidovorax sp. PRC11]|uniref:ABC transporter permease n=1 Tax=Acidovorax sp. PRC11 TaxID=2962592 RepID=UPI0028828287|nr:ABC transporter permease [Acidovorax sp. PRC11]MDT0137637.1 ABC transporter permease [Acidovorax sp. PRC11]